MCISDRMFKAGKIPQQLPGMFIQYRLSWYPNKIWINLTMDHLAATVTHRYRAIYIVILHTGVQIASARRIYNLHDIRYTIEIAFVFYLRILRWNCSHRHRSTLAGGTRYPGPGQIRHAPAHPGQMNIPRSSSDPR